MSAFKTHQDKETAKKIAAGGRCAFCISVLSLSKAKQSDLYDAMLDESIHLSTIHDVLGSWNILTSKTSIQNHRHGVGGYATHMTTLQKAANR